MYKCYVCQALHDAHSALIQHCKFFSIIAKLQGSGVANNVVLYVVESMEEYVNEVHESLKSKC